MKIAIAGGHGNIGQRLISQLVEAGDEVCSIDRNPAHASDIEALGAEPRTCDLESAEVDEVATAIDGVDAVVFAAGAGAGSGAERKQTMDYGGAAKLIKAAQRAGVCRYVIVSSIGADAEAVGDDDFSAYLRAKGRADAELASSGLDYTIIRPGRLTDDPGSGGVEVGTDIEGGEISRDDVAAVVNAALHSPDTIGKKFVLVAGEKSIEEALSTLS